MYRGKYVQVSGQTLQKKTMRNKCAATRSWQCCQARKPLSPSTQNITYLELFVFQLLRKQLNQILMPFSEALWDINIFPSLTR